MYTKTDEDFPKERCKVQVTPAAAQTYTSAACKCMFLFAKALDVKFGICATHVEIPFSFIENGQKHVEL